MRERQELAGRVRILLRDPSGRVVDQRQVDNLITTAGRTLLAKALTGAVQIQTQYVTIDVGSSAVAPTAGDTSLGARVDGAQAQFVAPKEMMERGASRVVATVTATLPPTGSATPQELQEAGIVISLPGQPSVLYNHVTFPVISRAGTLEMTLTWEVMF